MKALQVSLILCGLMIGWLNAAEPPADTAPPPSEPAETPASPADQSQEEAAPSAMPADESPAANPDSVPAESPPAMAPDAPSETPQDTADPGAAEPQQQPASKGQSLPNALTPSNTTPAQTTEPAEPAALVPPGEKGLRLNFRGVPLEMVLNYLSEAAGFVIITETDIKGKVDVWSNQPLTQDEAVNVLNTVLNKNGYAVIRNERTLKIVSKESAKTQDIPVKTGNDPKGIPKNDEMVTQIVPVRFVNAVQLSRDLQPLMPPQATVVANEGGNAIVITDTQINIRRMTEIIKALDTAISSVSSVRIFTLKNADAKSIATMLRDLFQQDTASQRGSAGVNPMQQLFQGGRGGMGPMGGMAGAMAGGRGTQSSGGSGRVATARVVAVADERSNSVVVSAPEDQMAVIEDLINKVDNSVEDVAELRVFQLKYADPQETADLLTSLFPDTTSTQGSRTQFQFGGPGGMRFGGGPGGSSSSSQSTRMQKQNRVIAVPDMRTSSIVVSAAHDLLEQIAKMIEQLDSDPARKQKVFVFSVENTDPTSVEEILRGLFESQNSRYGSQTSRSSTRQTGNQLNNRATQQSQSGRNTSSSAFGGSGSRATSQFGQ